MSNNISEKLSQVLELETKSKFADVIVLCDEIVVLCEKENDFTNLIDALCSKSDALVKLGKTKEAIICAEDCLAKSKKSIGKICFETAKSYNTIADIHFTTLSIDFALKYFAKSLAIFLQIPNTSI